MATTGDHGIIIPDPSTAGAVINDIRALALQVEAGLADVEAEVIAGIDLSDYATVSYVNGFTYTKAEIDALVADSGTSGTVIQVGGTQPASGWWLDTGQPIPGTPVTPTGPTWTDDLEAGGGAWTTPTEEGVTYSPASGTATAGQSVTVQAFAQTGYELQGQTSWSHAFPEAPPTPLLHDDFNRADTTGGGTLGGTWADPTTQWRITDNSARVGSVSLAGAGAYADIGVTSARVVGTLRFLTENTNSHVGVGLAGTVSTGNPTGYRAYTRLGVSTVSIGVRSNTSATLPSPVGSPWTLPAPVADGDVVDLRVVEDGSQALLSLYYNGTPVIENVAYTDVDRPTGTHAVLNAAGQTSNGGVDEITVYEN